MKTNGKSGINHFDTFQRKQTNLADVLTLSRNNHSVRKPFCRFDIIYFKTYDFLNEINSIAGTEKAVFIRLNNQDLNIVKWTAMLLLLLPVISVAKHEH